MADRSDPVPYAAPEYQQPPRFQMAWGGWVLLALLLLAVLMPLARWVAGLL